jgi:hypothetical protein
MYCCCEKVKPTLGQVDIVLSDIEQNTKNNEIYSFNKLISNNSNTNKRNHLNINNEKNKNTIIKNDTQNTILSYGSHHIIINKLSKNIINDSNICSSNLNKLKNEYKISHKSIMNTTRNIFDYGKNNINNINNTKSENCRFSFSNYYNGSIIKEESKKNNQQESSNNYFNNYYKKLSILSKMTDNFSFREETNDFNNLILLLKNRNITEEEILSTKKLKIIGNPSDFFYDKEIIINAGGICKETIISNNKNENQFNNNSPKQAKYENIGITFFGQNNTNKNKNFVFMNYNREKFNDYNNTDTIVQEMVPPPQ